MEIYNLKNKWISIQYFFIRNKKILIIGLIIVIALIVGYNYWQSYKASCLQKSAQSFELISSKLQTSSKQALVIGEKFVDCSNNIYGILTSIELAKIAVEQNNIISAEKYLLKALSIAKLDDIKDLINFRLARIQLALNKTEHALITLTKIKNKNWRIIVENIRGDIFLKRNDITNARLAYSNGIESSGIEVMKTILKIKINNLPN